MVLFVYWFKEDCVNVLKNIIVYYIFYVDLLIDVLIYGVNFVVWGYF